MRWTWEDTFEIIGDTFKGIIIGFIVGGTGACLMLFVGIISFLLNQTLGYIMLG